MENFQNSSNNQNPQENQFIGNNNLGTSANNNRARDDSTGFMHNPNAMAAGNGARPPSMYSRSDGGSMESTNNLGAGNSGNTANSFENFNFTPRGINNNYANSMENLGTSYMPHAGGSSEGNNESVYVPIAKRHSAPLWRPNVGYGNNDYGWNAKASRSDIQNSFNATQGPPPGINEFTPRANSNIFYPQAQHANPDNNGASSFTERTPMESGFSPDRTNFMYVPPNNETARPNSPNFLFVPPNENTTVNAGNSGGFIPPNDITPGVRNFIYGPQSDPNNAVNRNFSYGHQQNDANTGANRNFQYGQQQNDANTAGNRNFLYGQQQNDPTVAGNRNFLYGQQQNDPNTVGNRNFLYGQQQNDPNTGANRNFQYGQQQNDANVAGNRNFLYGQQQNDPNVAGNRNFSYGSQQDNIGNQQSGASCPLPETSNNANEKGLNYNNRPVPPWRPKLCYNSLHEKIKADIEWNARALDRHGNDTYLSEIERALFSDTSKQPNSNTKEYFDKAQDYAIMGNHFFDFPKELPGFGLPKSQEGLRGNEAQKPNLNLNANISNEPSTSTNMSMMPGAGANLIPMSGANMPMPGANPMPGSMSGINPMSGANPMSGTNPMSSNLFPPNRFWRN